MTETEFLKKFGHNLQTELKDCWMSQKELSEETGIAESTISYYLRGERMPSLKNVINISRVLSCDVHDLIELDEIIE